MKVKEWVSNNPQNKIVLPDEVIRRFKYRVLVKPLNEKATQVWCEEVEHEPMIQSLRLKFALFDTSERYEGITLTARWTLYSEVQYLGQFTATVLPIEEDDV